MTALNKQALLRAAVKVGAHTWEAEGSQVWSMSNGTAESLLLEVFGDETSGQQDCDIASFIAEASPANVMALLDENLQLQRDKDSLEAVAIALRDDMRDAREKLEAAEKRIAEQREYYGGVIADGSRRMAELEAKIETADKLQDSAFRHGLQHGFSYGQTNDQAGYEQCLKSYSSRGKDNG